MIRRSLFFIALCIGINAFAVDQDSVEEFKIRKQTVHDRFEDFYARQKRVEKARKERLIAAQEQAEFRKQQEEIRERNRKRFKRPVKISNEEAEKLHEEKLKKQAKKRAELLKFYLKKTKEEVRLKEEIKKIPENDELNLPKYDEILWSKETAEKKRGQSGW